MLKKLDFYVESCNIEDFLVATMTMSEFHFPFTFCYYMVSLFQKKAPTQDSDKVFFCTRTLNLNEIATMDD